MQARLIALILSFSGITFGQTYTIETFAGGGLPPEGPAVAASIGPAQGIVADGFGNVYFSIPDYHVVMRIDGSGILSRVAGNGSATYGGDGGPAAQTPLDKPQGLAVDASGDLYIAENGRIRKVSHGIISTAVGGGPLLNDGPAASVHLQSPTSLAFCPNGDMYFADGNKIRKVSADLVTTIAGNGTPGFGGDGGPASSASISGPTGLVCDGQGRLYLSDGGNRRVRMISNGIITTVAGSGVQGYGGDNISAVSGQFQWPGALAMDSAGNLFIADNARIREVSNGIITTVAGLPMAFGDSGDGQLAVLAKLGSVFGLAEDAAGNLFLADTTYCRIRKIANGVITTIAGNGAPFTGDGGLAASAYVVPNGVALDGTGAVYISDGRDPVASVPTTGGIRKVSNGEIATIAGGVFGVGIAATEPALGNPAGIAIDAAGNVYFADTDANRIRRLSGGTVTTIAGTGDSGFGGDGGPAAGAMLNSPIGLAIDASGNLYIADNGNNRIRKISAGVITTVAGDGTARYGGDGGPAVSAQLWGPTGVAVDAFGNLYIADYRNHRVRMVSNGVITTVAGNGSSLFNGDGLLAKDSSLYAPYSVACDSQGNLYISDVTIPPSGRMIRKVTGGVMTSIAIGSLSGISSGDGGPATAAGFSTVMSMAVDAAGNVYLADGPNKRLRVLVPHAQFFSGQASVGNGVLYLGLASGRAFGYYSFLANSWIYHVDLGYEYVSPGNGSDVYFWDLASGHWWYTNPNTFPYLYDFTLKAWLFYFPDGQNAGRYTTGPRCFANISTGEVIWF